MTLGDAIVAAHARGDHEERNRLMWLANDRATVRDLAGLLGVSVNGAWHWIQNGRGNACSRLESAAPEGTLVTADKLAPATRERPGAAASRSKP